MREPGFDVLDARDEQICSRAPTSAAFKLDVYENGSGSMAWVALLRSEVRSERAMRMGMGVSKRPGSPA